MLSAPPCELLTSPASCLPPHCRLIRELKAENEKLKKMLAEAGGNFSALAAAAEAGTVAEAPPPNTLTEDDLQKEIARAVQSVEGVSEADKEKARGPTPPPGTRRRCLPPSALHRGS